MEVIKDKNYLLKEIDSIQKRMEELRILFINKEISTLEYMDFLNEFLSKLIILEEQKFELDESDDGKINYDLVKKIILNSKDNWEHLSDEDKKQFIINLISDIKEQNEKNFKKCLKKQSKSIIL